MLSSGRTEGCICMKKKDWYQCLQNLLAPQPKRCILQYRGFQTQWLCSVTMGLKYCKRWYRQLWLIWNADYYELIILEKTLRTANKTPKDCSVKFDITNFRFKGNPEQRYVHFKPVYCTPCFVFKVWPGGLSASWKISFWKNANAPSLPAGQIRRPYQPQYRGVGGSGSSSEVIVRLKFRTDRLFTTSRLFFNMSASLASSQIFNAAQIWNLKVRKNIKVVKACILCKLWQRSLE